MKKIIIVIAIILSLSFLMASQKDDFACYVCNDNTKVKYYNPDSKEKREQAKRVFKCDIVGRVPYCDDFIGIVR